MKQEQTVRRLPSGKYTRSVTRYVREWNGLAKPVAKALGCHVIASDPGILLGVDDAPGCGGVSLPASVAMRIKALIDLTKTSQAR